MSRREDVYRVLCLTLLALFLVFSLIITDVFVDIDGLIHGNKIEDLLKTKNYEDETKIENLEETLKKIDSENEKLGRNKRSSSDYLFKFHHSPEAKKLINIQIDSLLQQLDEEYTTQTNEAKKERYNIKDGETRRDITEKTNEIYKKTKDDRDNERGSMKDLINNAKETDNNQDNKRDLKDFIKLYRDTNGDRENKIDRKDATKMFDDNERNDYYELALKNFLLDGMIHHKEEVSNVLGELYKKEPLNIENFLLLEKSKDIAKSLRNGADKDIIKHCEDRLTKIKEDVQKPNVREGTKMNVPKLLVKATIDISTVNDNNSYTKDNVESAVNIVVNGIKIDHNSDHDNTKEHATNGDHIKENEFIKKRHLNEFIEDYLRIVPTKTQAEVAIEPKSDRTKRHIKVRVNDKEPKQGAREKGKHGDDVYVEIETHFDKKAGKSKRKFMKRLISKIQHAIKADTKENKKDFAKNWHIKKREQSPLEFDVGMKDLDNTVDSDIVKSRVMNPINSISKEQIGYDVRKDVWKKKRDAPNLIENVEKDKGSVYIEDVIPKRLQKPLYSTDSEEKATFIDMGDMQLAIKNVEGTGFSIGFNHYTDRPPDAENLKVFHGIENLIRTYSQNYDVSESGEGAVDIEKRSLHNVNKRDAIYSNKSENEHTIKDERKLLFLYHREKDSTNQGEDLKSQEINSKEIKDRSKRSIKVEKFSGVNNRIHLNRFLNTNVREILHRRRKRQISNMHFGVKMTKSEEDIFMDEPVKRYNDIHTTEDDNIFTFPLDEKLDTKDMNISPLPNYPHILTENTDDKIENIENVSSTDLNGLVQALAPSNKKYKVTIKVLPKSINFTSNPDFKAVHTSINKTYKLDDGKYYSQVNVSHIFEKENDTRKNMFENDVTEDLDIIKFLMANVEEHTKSNIDNDKKDSAVTEIYDSYFDDLLDATPNNTALTDKTVDEQQYETAYNKDSLIFKEITTNITDKLDTNLNKTKEILKKLDKNNEMLKKVLKNINNSYHTDAGVVQIVTKENKITKTTKKVEAKSTTKTVATKDKNPVTVVTQKPVDYTTKFSLVHANIDPINKQKGFYLDDFDRQYRWATDIDNFKSSRMDVKENNHIIETHKQPYLLT